MEIVGRIKQMPEVVNGVSASGKSWQKREVLIDDEQGSYPNTLVLTAFGEKVEKLNTFNVGDLVRILFDTKAREYNGKYYNSIMLYEIELAEVQQQPQPVAQPQPQMAYAQPIPQPQPVPVQPIQQTQYTDNLPF